MGRPSGVTVDCVGYSLYPGTPGGRYPPPMACLSCIAPAAKRPPQHPCLVRSYSLASELASKERVAHEATRLAVGRGQEFIPTVAPRLQKHQVRTGTGEGCVR